MLKVDLITGFLGAGKTTFIKKYVDFLIRKGQKVHIIENEFGPVSVDTKLLKEFQDVCGVSDLTGKCMCCVGKKAFINLLCEASRQGYDRVIVEPSGIYDVDEFFETMNHPRVNSCCETGAVITIVDPYIDPRWSDEVRYLMFAQLLAAGRILLSKAQLYTKDQIAAAGQWISVLTREYFPEADLSDMTERRAWDELSDEDMLSLASAGSHRIIHDRKAFSHAETFQTIPIAGRVLDGDDLKTRLQRLYNCPEYGNVFRVKGVIKDVNENWYMVNSTEEFSEITPIEVKKGLLVIIGQGLNSESVQSVFISK